MKVLLKFGGVCLSTRRDLEKTVSIIKELVRSDTKVAVVTSASTHLTDKLIETASKVKMGEKKVLSVFTQNLHSEYEKLTKETVKEKDTRGELLRWIKGEISELSSLLSGVSYLGELTPRTMDLILSFGEAFPTMILYSILKEEGVPCKPFPKDGAGIVTDENFGDANPLKKVTAQKVRMKLRPLFDEGVVPIVAGFSASTQDGVTTTLGRGGSDYTATLIGSSLEVDEIVIWTDVDGLMTADPKVENEAITIPSLSYEEAAEMAYFGVKSMHPKALEPASEYGIPLRIRSLHNPYNRGTLISGRNKSMNIVKALSLIKDVALLTVSGAGMVGTPGVAAKTFSLLGENNINILMISQGSSEANISFVIPKKSLDKAYNTLELSLLGTEIVKTIEYEDDICVVAVIGGGMKGTPGVAARIFNAVAKARVNVRMIAQGSSELNISFVVKEEAGEKSIRVLHNEFRLGKS